MGFVKAFFNKFLGLFKQGLSSKDVLKSVVFGFLISIFPIWGVSSLLIGILGVKMKLNIPIMLAISYLAIPAQVYFMMTFIKIGEKVFGVNHTLLTVSDIQIALQNNFIDAIQRLWMEVLCGVSGWSIAILPMLYLLFRLFNKLNLK